MDTTWEEAEELRIAPKCDQSVAKRGPIHPSWRGINKLSVISHTYGIIFAELSLN